jgi:hypothetical protein
MNYVLIELIKALGDGEEAPPSVSRLRLIIRLFIVAFAFLSLSLSPVEII